jgi:hypothetical protein
LSEVSYSLNSNQTIKIEHSPWVLKSILDPKWNIQLPWHCRVNRAGYFDVTGRKYKLPQKLKNVINEMGCPYLQYLVGLVPMTLPYYELFREKFIFPEILIID